MRIPNEILMHLRSSSKFSSDISIEEPVETDKNGTLSLLKCHTNDGNEDVYIGNVKMKFKSLLNKMPSVTIKEIDGNCP